MGYSRGLLKYQQEALGIKEKVHLALAKLGRLGMEKNSASDTGAPKRKVTLFDCVVLVYDIPVLMLMLPQSS